MQENPQLERVRQLVLRYGWNNTSYQIINPGIKHWFSKDTDSVIGYVTYKKFRLVVGAPICDVKKLPDVTREFEAETQSKNERVCYVGAEARLESFCRDKDSYSMVLLGAQPVWNPEHWSNIIASKSSLRAQLNRAKNKGVTVSEISSAQAAKNPELQRCLEEWLAAKGLPPLHFMVEPETLARLDDRRVFVAKEKSNVVGFVVASPIAQKNGWLIEQTIRKANAPNGTVELLIDNAARAMAEDNAGYLTLGISPLSRRANFSEEDNPLWIKMVLSRLRAHTVRFYNFEGLDAFKAKFQPESWEPVFAISNERDFSFSALYAIGAAFSGGSPVATLLRAVTRAVTTEFKWAASKLSQNRRT